MRVTTDQKWFKKRRLGFLIYFSVLFLGLLAPLCDAANYSRADYPQWWVERGVITNSAVTNDFALLNAGQLRWLVKSACEEMNSRAGMGAGAEITSYVENFINANNSNVVNRGQLKHAASLFFDRMTETMGRSPVYSASYIGRKLGPYPWPMLSIDANDFLPANVGQAKNLFKFWWDGYNARWQNEILDAVLSQSTNNTAIYLFAPISSRSWEAYTAVMSFYDSIFTPAEAGWSKYYLCGSQEGGGWVSSGLAFRVGNQDYALPVNDSVDISQSMDGPSGVALISTASTIYLQDSVYLVKWNPGNLKMEVGAIQDDGKAMMTLSLEGFAPPPHAGGWELPVDILVCRGDSWDPLPQVVFNQNEQSISKEISIGAGSVTIRAGNYWGGVFFERASTNIVLASMSLAEDRLDECFHFPPLPDQPPAPWYVIYAVITPEDAPSGVLRVYLGGTHEGTPLYESSAGPGTNRITSLTPGYYTVVWSNGSQVLSGSIGLIYDVKDCTKYHPRFSFHFEEPDGDRQPEPAHPPGSVSLGREAQGNLSGVYMRDSPPYSILISWDDPNILVNGNAAPFELTGMSQTFEEPITVALANGSTVPFNDATIWAILCSNSVPTSEPDSWSIGAGFDFDMFVDVDVDSDNQHGLIEPLQKDNEDASEDYSPGKIIVVNKSDEDGDGLRDYGDFDGGGGPFVPMVINLPVWVNLADAKISISCDNWPDWQYPQSDPSGISSNQDGSWNIPEGSLRIWRKNGSEVRDVNPVSNGGDWVQDGLYTDLASLGFEGDRCVLYLEGVKAGNTRIKVAFGSSLGNLLPWHDSVQLTVMEFATTVKYCRGDKDESVESNWTPGIQVAAGGLPSGVHKARVCISVTPALPGIPISAGISGGTGDLISAEFVADAYETNGNGKLYGTFRSSDKIEDVSLRILSLNGATLDQITGAKIQQVWDVAGDYDFYYPEYFVPDEPDQVSFYPTLDVPGGVGAIDGHSMAYYTPSAEISWYEYDGLADTFFAETITVSYPLYTGIPFGVSIDDLVSQFPAMEISSGVYQNTQTVHDYWDYNPGTESIKSIEVNEYEFSAYDESLVAQ